MRGLSLYTDKYLERDPLHTHRTQILLDSEADDGVPEGYGLARPAASGLRPTEEMKRAKGWVERISKPPVPDNDLLATHGWLSPSGELFACGWEKHTELSRAMGFSHDSEVEAAGYCKLTQLNWLVSPKYCACPLTMEQWKTIEKWYEKNRFPEEHFIRLGTHR